MTSIRPHAARQVEAGSPRTPTPRPAPSCERARRGRGGDAAAPPTSTDRFDGTLEFGTAGLRGALGAGPEPDEPGGRHPRRGRPRGVPADQGAGATAAVVIGYDARHNSDVFARDTAEVMTGAGLRRPGAAPAAADAAAGVRDPRARLRRRRDGDREPQPAARQRLQGLPRRRQPDRAAGRRRDRRPDRRGRPARRRAARRRLARSSTTSIVDALPRHGRRPRPPTARATSTSSTRRCTASAATSVVQVLETRRLRRAARRGRSRSSPTPTSRPSRSPTPRSRARWTSRWRWPRERGADLVVANDPDADRCAAAVPDAARLADAARRRGRRAARPTTCCAAGTQGTYACSIVSSSLLGKMAAAAGQPYAETLTGFKWISRVDGPGVRLRGGARLLRRPRAREGQGRRLGAAAALRARRRAEGRRADAGRPARRHRRRARPARHRPALGPRRPTCAEIAAAMERLRAHPPTSARRPGGRVGRRPRRRAVGGLPPTDGLRYRLADGARVIVRPSGTEPKLKCYLEVVVPCDAEDGVDAARISAAGRLDALRDDIRPPPASERDRRACRSDARRRAHGCRQPRHITQASAIRAQRSADAV